MRTISLRPSGSDELGLRRALSDRLLPFLVASMTVLAALALAGWVGAAALATSWQKGSGSALTVQVPDPDEASHAAGESRSRRALTSLRGTPGVTSARQLSADELSALLKPWLGSEAGRLDVPLPAIIAVHLADASIDLRSFTRRLADEVPGVLVEEHGRWIGRLTDLARSLQACAGLALLLVILVSAAVVTVATRSGLSMRRDAIAIVHGLGASDGYIAARFAGRATLLATMGGVAGAVLALPVLMALARMSLPFSSTGASDIGDLDPLATLPLELWLSVLSLPLAAAILGFVTAHGTVRLWLRRIP